MSTDRITLSALVRHTTKELRYFELIALRFEGRTDQIFLCVGKHALHFVKRNLSGLYLGKNGGEIFYAHVLRLVEDEQSDTDLVIVLNENRPSEWPSEKIFLVSENRTCLVEHLTVAWQTDHAWRMGRITTLPRTQLPLRKRLQPGKLRLNPFSQCRQVTHDGLSFFLPQQFTAKSFRRGTVATFMDETRELEIALRVEEPESLEEFGVNCHDHIRWVATDFRQAVTENLSDVMLLRNAFYLKKMNLGNDIACWTGWEVFFKADSCAMAAIFLRRQYIPPMLDAAQDMSIVLSCPVHILAEGIMDESDMLHEIRVVADSVAPVVQDCTQHQTLYRDMIQAKIDTLLYPEDALTWLDSVFSLQRGDHQEDGNSLTLRRPSCEMEAWTFIKSLMTVLQEENALSNPEMLSLCPPGVPVLSKPLTVKDFLMDKLEAMREIPQGSIDRESDPIMNAWMARVARFMAHCVDGFLLGKRFTLCDVAGVTIHTDKNRQKIESSILWMLHVRPKDMNTPFLVMSIKHILHDASFFHDYTFNDRVMQSLLELGWIARHLTNPSEQSEDEASKAMSLDYATFLAHLLMMQGSSMNLKATICRQIIANDSSQVHFAVLMPAVLDCLRQRSLYLKTYATVVFVNLSRGHDVVKQALMKERIGNVLMENFRLQDDDLTHYSLVLLIHMTKLAHHRDEFWKRNSSMSETLTNLLRASVNAPSKKAILAATMTVIGQLCLDDRFWMIFAGETVTTVNILLDVHEDAELGSKVKAKVMFALRQTCSRTKAVPPHLNKEVMGNHLITKVIAELEHVADLIRKKELQVNTFDPECTTCAVELLWVLSVVRKNCDLMVRLGLVEALEEIMASPLCDLDSSRMMPDTTCERISQLWQTLHGRYYMAEGMAQKPNQSRGTRSTEEAEQKAQQKGRRDTLSSVASRNSRSSRLSNLI